MPRLCILDVGHGNCAVLEDREGVTVIDAGPGSALKEFLIQEKISRIRVLLISHSDLDHISGVMAVISSDVKIDEIRLNGDPTQNSDEWQDMIASLNLFNRKGKTRLEPALTVNQQYRFGEILVEVLWPEPYGIGKGIGGHDGEGIRLERHSQSVVVRVVSRDELMVLFPGDISQSGLDALLDSGKDPRANVLVFPHHGGKPGGADPKRFTETLCSAVKPDVVVFSIGRSNKYGTPRPEIVKTILTSQPGVRIVCTQLSTDCAASIPEQTPTHLTPLYARGRETRSCCGGTLVISLDDTKSPLLPNSKDHQSFIRKFIPTPTCRGS